MTAGPLVPPQSALGHGSHTLPARHHGAILCSTLGLAFLPQSSVRTCSSPLSPCISSAQTKAQAGASVLAQQAELSLDTWWGVLLCVPVLCFCSSSWPTHLGSSR